MPAPDLDAGLFREGEPDAVPETAEPERPPKLSTAEVRAALRERFKAPEYAYFDEVRDGTGGHFLGTADALAMSVWPSRGLVLIGMEIKVSRSDWLRELKNPRKNERIQLQCDRWYLVVGDAKVLGAGELPTNWGLMVPRGKGLVIQKEAPQLEARPLSRELLASILRRAADVQPDKLAIDAAVKKAVAAAESGMKSGRDFELQRARADLERLRQAVKEFEAASGVRIYEYAGGDIGKAVAEVQSGGLQRRRQEYEELLWKVRQLHDAVEATVAGFPAAGSGQ
jgi:hypothetical protein